MRRDLPAGTVTFLFTDVEGSTRLLHELGAESYAEALAEHRQIVRDACGTRGGVEVDTQGDAFFLAFPNASDALAAARAITDGLASGRIALRIGLHTGTPVVTDEGYVGEDVHLAARIAAAAHGGQIVVSLATCALVDEDFSFVELGEHRLKDIAGPIAIYQLGDGEFPPLKTISNTNLPRPASSFVGRELELSELIGRLEGRARLITLTGPGGSGKTRLAIEAAASLVPEYSAGVFWVGLASLADPELVAETIAQTVGAKDGLAEHIGERRMLLLLDNLEQVIEAASELSSLLQACPKLTIVATSRELLKIQGEDEYAVPPLAEAEAVTLFCARARTDADADIAELCRRLDNLPLAVELAAARTKALSAAQILERLSSRLDLLKGGRDADPRQQTLRATIEWSYELLPAEEKQLFRRLAVFAGGCALEAAEEVVGADLDTLQSLVEKSLVRFSNERYWMLETIREYAGEHLEGADELRGKHALFYGNLAEGLSRAVRAHDRSATAVVDTELANCRAGIAQALERRDTRLVGKYLYGLWFYWLGNAYGQEARKAAMAWLELDRDELEPSELVQALAAVSEIVRFVKSGPRDQSVRLAIALKHELVAVLQAHPEVPILDWSADALMAASLTDLAYLVLELGDTSSARRYAEEGLEVRRRLNDASGIAHALIAVAAVAAVKGDIAAAYESQLEALANAGDHPEAPAMEIAVAENEFLLGEVNSAAARVLANIEGIRGLRHHVFVASVARVAGLIVLSRGDARGAARLLGAYAHILEDAALEELAFYEVAPDIGRSATAGFEAARLTLGEEDYARELTQAAELDDDEILDTAAAALAPLGEPKQ
jgi:predicted ATPase/class 3 adenylate cyclase